MQDSFGRTITYLRVSVTDRCNFRCYYCMGDNIPFLPRNDLLSLEELDRVCSVFIRKGVRKIRITGGEPFVRCNVMWLMRRLSRHLAKGTLQELTLTTNGSLLAQYARKLTDIGIKRLNVSLDTLDSCLFNKITRFGNLDEILDGIQTAKEAGLKIKINAVVLRCINEDEINDLVSWCGKEGFDLSLIEFMPLGHVDRYRSKHYLPLSKLRDRLEKTWTLTDCLQTTGGPAKYVHVAETNQRIGFIRPLTDSHFCDTCNRVRLTCTGRLYMCLGQNHYIGLRRCLRSSQSDDALLNTISNALKHKPRSHEFIMPQYTRQNSLSSLSRYMNMMGG